MNHQPIIGQWDAPEPEKALSLTDQLYAHRNQLFVTLCGHRAMIARQEPAAHFQSVWMPWKSIVHSDGTFPEGGYFIMGINHREGDQITYHLPLSMWDECHFAITLPQAPKWDGHSSDDVLKRLKEL